eukprot:5392063-Pleurochrysis_carterae.AAC.1
MNESASQPIDLLSFVRGSGRATRRLYKVRASAASPCMHASEVRQPTRGCVTVEDAVLKQEMYVSNRSYI